MGNSQTTTINNYKYEEKDWIWEDIKGKFFKGIDVS